MQRSDSQEKPRTVVSKKMERNDGGLSHTPVELCKNQLDHPDIGPVLQWKESGPRPFGPDICTASATTRHYWNFWDMLQIENVAFMRHVIRKMLQGTICNFLYQEQYAQRFATLSNSLLGGHLGKKNDFIGVEYGRITIIGCKMA